MDFSSNNPSTRGSRLRRTAALLEQLKQAPTQQARAGLVEEIAAVNAALADVVVERYAGQGVSLADLERTAHEGLRDAAQRFDEESADDFLAYALASINTAVKARLREQDWPVRLPRPRRPSGPGRP